MNSQVRIFFLYPKTVYKCFFYCNTSNVTLQLDFRCFPRTIQHFELLWLILKLGWGKVSKFST